VNADGEEIKGIVLEDYKDRIVMSTFKGEITLMKSGIKELYYDDEENNLIKLAEQAREKHDYIRALTYYDMAFKANPNSKAAKDGLVFLEGYLFRKEQAQKEDDIKKRQDLESHGTTVQSEKPKVEEVSEKFSRLKKVTGMTIKVKDGFPYIESVVKHSPAYEAGVRVGDRLFAIWARLSGYMELNEVLDALLDKPSLELKCTIDRDVDIVLPAYRLLARGTNELIGAAFAMEFYGLTIASVREDGEASKAGLKKGDIITAINGKSTRYMPLNTAINAIRSTKGDIVKLTARREILIWRRD
jgi:C-terminal processing protease CtpA/Prc